MMKVKIARSVSYVLLWSLLLSGCSSTGSPRGRVLDVDTGMPVAGAYVLAQFVGDGPYVWPDPGATARNKCYGSWAMVTDDKGEFDFGKLGATRPESDEYTRNRRVEMTAYKSGHYLQDIIEDVTTVKRVELKLSRTKPASPALGALGGFCGWYTKYHHQWAQTRFRLDEAKAKTVSDWEGLARRCRQTNKEIENFKAWLKANPDVKVEMEGVEGSECAPFDRKMEEVKAQHFTNLKTIVDGIDWGKGPRLELVCYMELSMGERSSTFAIPDHPKGVSGKELFEALKMVCNSDYPKSVGDGTICIIFGNPPEQWEKTRSLSVCHAHYQKYEYKLKILHGIEMGTTIALKPDWCRPAQ